MKGYGRNTLIKTLRELGVSDSERKEMRELAKQLSNNDVYERIDRINKQVFGESVRPATLNYENALRSMSTTGKSFGDILQEYREHAKNLEQGTTSEINLYYNSVVDDLHSLGFRSKNINVETIKNIDQNGMLDSLLDQVRYLARYKSIERTGKVRQGSALEEELRRVKDHIREIISFYAV